MEVYMVKNATIEACVFSLSFFLHTLAPWLFYSFWILAILLGQQLVRNAKWRLRAFVFSILVGAPIGVLTAAAVHDHFELSVSMSALIGCGAAIIAEQILNGSLIGRATEKLMNRIDKDETINS